MNAGPLVPAVVTLLVFGATAQAQRSAFLTGRVLDPSGAAVPEAAITVVNQDSGFRRATSTGTDGVYVVASLPSGLYKVSVRSEEHTSELQSQFHLVCRLLLEKKNIN